MARLYEDYGHIRNDNKCVDILRDAVPSLSGKSKEQVVKIANERAERVNNHIYFDHNYDKLDESESGKEILWVDTGYSVNGATIYAQFTGGNPWVGAFIGTEAEIMAHQAQRELERKSQVSSKERFEQKYGVDLSSLEGVTVTLEEQQTEKVNKNLQFLQTLHEKLLIPNSWTVENLDSYINMCIARLNNLVAKGRDLSDNVIFNAERTSAIINTGLLDNFGKYILVQLKLYYIGKDEDKRFEFGYTGISFAKSKAVLSSEGFSKSDLAKQLERVSFADNITDLIFQDSIEDFDLENWASLNHSIVERRNRFPEEYQKSSNEVIYADITRAVEIAVELSRYDHNYIKPYYNKKADSICFVIPYHIGNNFQKKPELGLLIHNKSGYWQIATILDYDMVARDIKIFSLYENESF